MDVNQLLSTVETKTKAPEKFPTKKEEDKSFSNVMNSISKNWEETSPNEIDKLKKELNSAKKKIEKLETLNHTYTKNEEKILAAIRSESLIQKTDSPTISYNKFRKEYRVSSDYYRPSINSLLEKGLINQERATFSGNVKTYRWQIVQK